MWAYVYQASLAIFILQGLAVPVLLADAAVLLTLVIALRNAFADG